MWSQKFHKIHRKTPVPENIFLIKLPKVCNFIKKKSLAQVFSCEFCEISRNTFLQNTSRRVLLKDSRIKRPICFMKNFIQFFTQCMTTKYSVMQIICKSGNRLHIFSIYILCFYQASISSCLCSFSFVEVIKTR